MAYRIALVCLTPIPDGEELHGIDLPSYGVRRVQAAVVGDLENPGHVVELIELRKPSVAAYVERILAFEPDLLGFSIYVWSTACLVAVAREIRKRRPECVIAFGGPSARQSLFDLRFYRDPSDYLDVIVEGDGEIVFRDIAALPELTRATARTVPGATARHSLGWTRNPSRLQMIPADQLPSPFQLGLMPRGAVAYLETYRGCPMSCRFCEWGTNEQARDVFSTDYIEREIAGFERHDAPAVFLLDAGLNLNLRAFRNLREAGRRNPYLKKIKFWAEIYPSVIRDEHFEFLTEVGPSYLGVGMQSQDPAVLKLHQRPADSPKFERAVRALAAATSIELQIIFGLPGDTPEGFRRTFEYALSLPADVRVYHCLVLPDALLTRGLPEWNMEFDPRDLSMISCLGWTEDDIASVREELLRRARAYNGNAGHFWWSFPLASRPAARSA